jgi:hypothetical protein
MMMTQTMRTTMQRKRPLLLAVAALVVLSLSLLAAPRLASASTTFTVNLSKDTADATTADNLCDASLLSAGEQCTLRAAIQQANATDGADAIDFDIPGGGVRTIYPASPLPHITETVTIDGYSQPGSSVNTLLKKGTNAKLMIELDGEYAVTPPNTPAADGLAIEAKNCVVRGLVINRFAGRAIGFIGGGSVADGASIEGNFVGTDPTGTLDLGNHSAGLYMFENSDVTVGGTSPAQRNLISGNDSLGVAIFGDNISTNNEIQGNLIGTDSTGKGNLGNGMDGVAIMSGAADTTVTANTIAFNGRNGVWIVGDASTANRILGNSIFSNNDLGIDLAKLNELGPTPNDKKDLDTGANNLQNKPVLSSAKKSATGKTVVKGKLNSTASTTFKVQFYSDPSGNEGKRFLGQRKVSTDSSGKVSFTKALPKVGVGKAITATATNTSTGDTSEFSAPCKVASS